MTVPPPRLDNTTIDRPARIRRALRELVAERGFHGASMSAIARAAGVATGTAYVHYSSKEEIVIAAYVEAKRDLREAVSKAIGRQTSTRERFVALWCATYRHFQTDPNVPRFLLQVEQSPFSGPAHAAAMADHDDSFNDLCADLRATLIDLPPSVLYNLGIAPAYCLAAAGESLSDAQVLATANACWQAVSDR
ncbi:MAG: TetR/AcrR family transcriptional regulator [bacterium]|nr:TetR/AcrR family transcriptional regulator [Acidimicrobiia bacterium]MCY4650524.1 TetR/AcrR family transcriptional regulator [bacterium]